MSFSSNQSSDFYFNVNVNDILESIQDYNIFSCEECELQVNSDELHVCSSCNRQLCYDCFQSEFESLCYDCSNLSDDEKPLYLHFFKEFKQNLFSGLHE